ncbi:dynein regulatory complex subunit 7-like [Chelonus insularis]|uniref:dynein regulatory complex subunit 7-like n=1 Tax=Chelonus insularis TaxID=460826 RepID=UPI00158DC6C7|nr:dynein regulatory complex subunit 7-like [Chelonus insularis]
MELIDEQLVGNEGSFVYDRFASNEHQEQVFDDAQKTDKTCKHLNVTKEQLKQIKKDLGLIRLSWPNVQLDDLFLVQLPESYRTNTEKEKLLLWYAENFRKQYHTIFPDRKPLVLACNNECGVQKFVSTSIRPSTLPYPELHTWLGCARFVSDHLVYESLKRPLAMVSDLSI